MASLEIMVLVREVEKICEYIEGTRLYLVRSGVVYLNLPADNGPQTRPVRDISRFLDY